MFKYCSMMRRRNFFIMKLIYARFRLFLLYIWTVGGYLIQIYNTQYRLKLSLMSCTPLLHKLRYTHISILKKYNLKNHYRYKSADQWIAAHKFEHIKTYKDFCTKPKEVDKVQLTLSDQQWQYIRSTYLFERKSVAWTKQFGLEPYRLDDHQLAQPLQNQTLHSFAKQALRQRKPHQLQPFYLVAAFIIHIFLYFYFWYGTDNEDYIANTSLNSEVVETFNLINFEPYIKEYKRKIGVQLEELLTFPDKKNGDL